MKSIGHFLSDKNNWSLIVSALALVVSAIALRKNGFDKTVKRLELTKPIYVELESQLADAIADYSSAITMLIGRLFLTTCNLRLQLGDRSEPGTVNPCTSQP